jgi:quercetin dioxygenase-like cupin family protein
MMSVFPKPILNLPEADIPLEGVKGFLLQGSSEQVIFMEFRKNVIIPKHSHEGQWEIVIEGKVDLEIEGVKNTYKKGDRFFIPDGKKHSAKVYEGYASVVFFDQKDRYNKK